MDPLALLRAVMTSSAAIVMGSGFLLWHVRETLGQPGARRWRARVMAMILIAAAFGVLATLGVVVGTAGAAANARGSFAVAPETVWLLVSQTRPGNILLAAVVSSVATLVAAAAAWLLRGRTHGERVADEAGSETALEHIPLESIRFERQEYAPAFDSGAIPGRPGESTRWTSALETISLVAAAIAGLGLAAIAFASHPTSLAPEWLGLGSAILHRIALGLWLGGLPALLLLIGTGSGSDRAQPIAYPILERYSRLAIVAMSVLLVTGTILAWMIVGNFVSLIGTFYGLTLVAKLLALVAVLSIALGLRRHLLPKLAAAPSAAVLAQYASRVKIEFGFALLVVLLASVMGNSAPPEHEDIFWLLPFRLSFRATWGLPWVPVLFLGGSALALAGAALAVRAWRRRSGPANRRPKLGVALGGLTVLAGAALALPAISVRAYPDTYRTPNVDFAVESIARGLEQFEDTCTLCHGISGRGNGIAGFGLPVLPPDLTAPHAATHTAGDLYWRLTHGIPGSIMPVFADTLNVEDRWDVINFLQAFALGYQGRLLTTKVVPGRPWLGPPDLSVTDETGDTLRLRDYRRKSALLLVIAEGAGGTTRVGQLLSARNRLEKLGAKIVLVAPGADGDSLRALAKGSLLLVDKDTESAADTFGLFTRSAANAKSETARVPMQSAEFLIDRSGYLRARWLPDEDQDIAGWNDPEVLERQLMLLAQEPLWTPPKDHDH
jgi:putative copper resistance protein D